MTDLQLPNVPTEKLREMAATLGFTTCSSHDGDVGADVMRLALLSTIKVLTYAHTQQMDSTMTERAWFDSQEVVSGIVHNVMAAVGLEECDEPQHAGAADPDTCCGLTVARA